MGGKFGSQMWGVRYITMERKKIDHRISAFEKTLKYLNDIITIFLLLRKHTEACLERRDWMLENKAELIMEPKQSFHELPRRGQKFSKAGILELPV